MTRVRPAGVNDARAWAQLLTGRYDFTDAFALRGAISTGFRAPTPGQSNAEQVTTSFINGLLRDTAVLSPNNAIAQFNGQEFGKPINPGLPTNSPANDTYYFVHGDTNYVTSNRLGVYYSKNPTCCSDIFSLQKPVIVIPPTPKETLAELNKRLPVTLYFHNDWPDPKTNATTTKINYIDNYHDYVALIPTYKKEYSSGLTGERNLEAQEDIESFFTEYVDQGVKDSAPGLQTQAA